MHGVFGPIIRDRHLNFPKTQPKSAPVHLSGTPVVDGRPVRRSSGVSAHRQSGRVSTVWCHPTCGMPNIRPGGRQVGSRSMYRSSRDPLTFKTSGVVSSRISGTEAEWCVRSSTSRSCEHRMVSPDVWDAKHPTGRPSGGLEIDVSVVTRPFLTSPAGMHA